MSTMADAPVPLKSTVVFKMPLEGHDTYPKLDPMPHLSKAQLLQQKRLCMEIHKEHSAIVTQSKVVRIVHHVQHDGIDLAIEPSQGVRRSALDNSEHSVGSCFESSSTLESRSKQSVAIELAHAVAALAFTTCGGYLAIADESGALHLYKIDGTLLLTYPIITDRSDSDRIVSMTFASKSCSTQQENLIVVTSKGLAIHFSDISMLKIEESLEVNHDNAFNSILEQIQLRRINVGSLDSGAHSVLLVHRSRSACVFVLANHVYSLTGWRVKPEDRFTPEKSKIIDQLSSCRIPSSLAVESMKFVPDRKFILVLTTDGNISWWDWYGMIFYSQLRISSILSFNVINPFPLHDQKEKIVIVVTKLLDSDTQAIKVELIEVLVSRRGQGFDCRTLAYLKDIESSEPYMLDVSSDEGAILKHQFIVVYRSRRNIMALSCNIHNSSACLNSNMLNCENDASGDPGVGEKETAVSISLGLLDIPVDMFFRSTQDQMLQYKFELESCIQSIGQNEDDSRTILRHLFALASKLRSYIALSSSPSLSDYILKWCDHVSETNFKWTTFELLRSSSVEGQKASMTLREQWLLFSQSDVISLLEHYMRKGAMRAVMILWRRHLNDQLIMVISDLLQLLPISLSVRVYENWVKQEVIPAIFRLSERHMSVMQHFARWVLERAEIAAAQGYIDTAVRFAALFQDSACPTNSLSFFQNLNLQASEEGCRSSFCKFEEKEGFDPFQRLKLLTEKLQHIQYLTKTHNFGMTLARFNDESPMSIAKSMLDRVPSSDLLIDEISEHVKKYLSYCGIESDPVLSSYVIELAEALHTSNQEARVLIVLESIADVDVRVDTALAVFGSSRPPYSSALKKYAQATKLLNSNRQEEVENFVQLMDLQDMLISYGIKKFNVGDTRGATRLMNHILGQISRHTAFKDALRLVDAYGHLRSVNAASRYIENLITFPCQTSPGDLRTTNDVLSAEVSARVIKAIDAIHYVKKREENPMVVLLLVENTAQLGLTLLEMKETHQVHFPLIQRKNYEAESTITWLKFDKHISFLLAMILALVEVLLAEIHALRSSAVNERHENVLTYISSPNFLLSTHLLSDLQKIKRIETEWGILLSIRTLRDPERREARIRLHMKPEVIFASDFFQNGDNSEEFKSKVVVNRSGQKRIAQPYNEHELQSPPLKKYRNSCTGGAARSTCVTARSAQLQQGDEEAQSMANLRRFASSLGITPSTYHSLIARCAADNGSILRAVRFSRDLFSRRRERTRKTEASNNAKQLITAKSRSTDINGNSQTCEFASILKNISLSISRYTAMNVDNVYDFLKMTQTRQTPIELARLRAPLYSMELLRYSICVCDMDSFEETLLLLKNATLLNEVLRFTELDVTSNKSDHDLLNWRLYSQFYRGDPCVLPCAQTMRLASRFVIAEHRKLIDRADLDDFTPSRRYISFLVENSATLLSLQVLLSMRMIPEDAYSVIQAQLGKLLSTVFQSHYIDTQLALGLMLAMEQVNAFNEFRGQISRENVAKEFKRFQQLAFIGSDAARAWQQIAFLHQCVELEGNARWWHYLNLLGIECDHKAFKGDRRDLGYIRSLVPTLLIKSNFDFYTVLDFTRHYNVDDSYPSVTYVEMLLLRKDQASEINSRSLEYQDKIVGVLEDIHDHQLVTVLLQCLPHIEGADYERILFVFQVLLQHTSYQYKEEVKRRIEVLQILQQFADSISERCETNQNGKQLQTCSTKEISFHDLMANPMKALATHLRTENFTFLVALSIPLRVKTDEFCMLLLRNMVQDAFGVSVGAITSHTGGLKKYQNPHMSSRNPPDCNSTVTFDTFRNVLSQVKDEENVITAAEWLAEQFPARKEKLKTLEFALGIMTHRHGRRRDITNSTKQSSTDITDHVSVGHKTVARLKSKILRTKIEIILQAANIQKKNLLDFLNEQSQESDELDLLALKPRELFFEIYRRFTLAFSAEGNNALHDVADSFADLLKICANDLRMELINEWLIKDANTIIKNTVTTDEESIFESLQTEVKQQVDEDFIKKILYVTVRLISEGNQTSQAREMITFLTKFAREVKPRAGVTHRAKHRALIVLLRLYQVQHSIFSEYVAHNLPQLTRGVPGFLKEILQYTCHCKHMVIFEEHHVPFDMAFLLKTNKEALVRSLLRQFPTQEPWVLQCASQWMLDFEVDAVDIWETLLTSMRSRGMKRFMLMHVLEPLSRKSFIRRLEHGTEIWEEILLSPLLQLKCAQTKHNQRQSNHHFVMSLNLDGTSLHIGKNKLKSEDVNNVKAGSGSDIATTDFCGYSIASVHVVLNQMANLLQICPFLDQVDVPAFVIHLRDLTLVAETGPAMTSDLNLYQFAAKCAMAIPKPKARFQALSRIVQAGAYMAVLRELLDISCFLSGTRIEDDDDEEELSEQVCLAQNIFAEVASRGSYQHLLQSEYEQAFLEYLAATKNIDGVLAILLGERRLEVASRVVELFHQFNQTAAPPNDADSEDRWHSLKMYVISSTSSCLEVFRNQL